MSVLFLVLPLSLLIATAGVWAFVWSVRGGQFDDLDGPPMRMLHDGGDFQAPTDPSSPKPRAASKAELIMHPSAGARGDGSAPRPKARHLFAEGPIDP